MQRHYGMDWLRIGAFALLILYHVGMVFVPWGFHIKTAQPAAWVEIPMLLTNPWRLTLLFVVSGFASRALLSASSGLGGFLKNRNARLLLPLAFGVVVIVPPQTWVELTTQHGYTQGFGWFWLHDYFRFGTLATIIMPTWNHLWFVVYLWVYTLALCLLALLPGTNRLQCTFDRLFGGTRALWLPLAFLLVTQWWLFHREDDTHDLFNDGLAHLQYFPAFLFGFGLAGSRRTMDGLSRHWKLSAAIALASYATIAGLLIAWPDFSFPTHAVATAFRLARELESWAAIAALIGLAERFLDRDNRWRATLAEATFPFYIIHQTIIVMVEYWLRPLHIDALAEFAILVPATVAGCWAFYLIGRRIGALRPFIGLKRHPRAASDARHDRKADLDAGGPWWRRADRTRPDLA
ncbi:acyltransferase [Sphingomonas sp. RT2P30]|uniref:acyltransferase family protein n=1 Tax=Parasphingomonas halimpatiens TaxID=3096162 RepID=UPI002FC7F34F